MRLEVITERNDLLIRRQLLEPGEATPWHSDACHRFSVVIRGARLAIEYRDSGDREEFDAMPGEAGWDAPEPRIHRAVNLGADTFEEVVTFYREPPGIDPQPGPRSDS